MATKRAELQSAARDVRAKFGQLDEDGNGTLSFEEMELFFKLLNPSFSANQIQQLFCQVDANDNGVVELDEFVNYMLLGERAPPDATPERPQGKPAVEGLREEWIKQTVDSHNHFRAAHGAPPLTWSDECYLSAKTQADACQERGSMFHGTCEGPSGRHGQNIFWCSRPGSSAYRCTKSWYDELVDPGYDFSSPGFRGGTGHFTQVVWNGSQSIGMAVSEDGKFVVANYYPAGNFMGRFPENVKPRSTAYDPRADQPPPGCSSEPPRAMPKAAPKAKANAAVAATSSRIGSEGTRDLQTSAIHAGGNKVVGTSLTPEMTAIFDGCPFPFIDKVKEAFAGGGATVSVTRSQAGRSTELVVEIKQGCSTRRMKGSWGGG